MSAPTTSVITNFTGSENPLSEGSTWTSKIRSGDAGGLKKAADVCAVSTGAGTCSSWYNVQTYTDVEAFLTLTALSANSSNNVQLWTRITDAGGSGTVDCYTCVLQFVSGANYQIEHFRVNNGAFTSLGVISNTLALANGDKLFSKVTGTGSVVTIEANVFTGGNWVRVGSVDDPDTNRLTGAGNLGIVIIDGSAGGLTVDDFGGGTTTAFTGATVAWTGA